MSLLYILGSPENTSNLDKLPKLKTAKAKLVDRNRQEKKKAIKPKATIDNENDDKKSKKIPSNRILKKLLK